MHAWFAPAAGLALVAAAVAPAQAGVIAVDSRAALSGPTFDFGSLGSPGKFLATPEKTPVGATSLTFASSSGVLAMRREGADWTGDFAPGANLLAQIDYDRSDSFIVGFSGAPIYGLGTQIQPGSGYLGAFTAQMTLFGADGAKLGSVTVGGTSSKNEDGSAAFIGALSTDPIASASFTVSTGYAGFPTEGDLAIDSLSLGTAAPVPGATAAVPEPAAALLLGSAVLLAAGVARPRHSFSRTPARNDAPGAA